MNQRREGLRRGRLTAAVLGALLLAAAPVGAADEKETPPPDLEALERYVERSAGELEMLGRMHGVYLEAMQRLFECVPRYFWPKFMDRVVELPPEEVVEYLRRIDFDPLDFDLVARHCLFPSRSLAVEGGVSGRYSFPGTINGVPVRFVVDTGATGVAVTETSARRAGLVWGERTQAMTPAGPSPDYRTVIDRLELGPAALVLENVDRAWIVPAMEGEALFGTPYLGQFLDMHTVGSTLFLQAKRGGSDTARRVSRAVRALLLAFHMLQNECGKPLPDTAAARACLSIDPETGRAPDAVAERVQEGYGPVLTALQLD